MKLIIDIPEENYKLICSDGRPFLPSYKWIKNGIPIPTTATRKDVHKLIFGIEPPELGSPYCACVNEGCETCRYKDDLNCDVNWWNAPY